MLKPVREPGSKSVVRQWYEIVRLMVTAQITPSEYYMYDIHNKNKSIKDMSRYLPYSLWIEKVRPQLINWRFDHVLQNKWLFHVYYKSFGLPVTHVYAYLAGHTKELTGGLTGGGNQLNNLDELITYVYEIKPDTLVVKPVVGGVGRDVHIFDSLNYEREGIQGITISGKEYNLAELFRSYKPTHGILLEEKNSKHPFFERLNPFTSNVLRIITLLKAGGEPEILFAIAKFGRKGSETEHFRQGGFSRAINTDSGMMQDTALISDKVRNRWVRAHPDLETPFKCEKIPMWDQIIETAKNFSRATPFASIVGWDLMLTANGPVVIEGNHDFGFNATQSHSDGFLTEELINDLRALGVDIKYNSFKRVNLKAMRTALQRWI